MIDYEALCQTIEDWRAGRRPSLDFSSASADSAHASGEYPSPPPYNEDGYETPPQYGEAAENTADSYYENPGDPSALPYGDSGAQEVSSPYTDYPQYDESPPSGEPHSVAESYHDADAYDGGSYPTADPGASADPEHNVENYEYPPQYEVSDASSTPSQPIQTEYDASPYPPPGDDPDSVSGYTEPSVSAGGTAPIDIDDEESDDGDQPH